jgi:putative flippase GtrA
MSIHRFFVKPILGLWQNDKVRYLLAGCWNTLFGYSVFVGLYYLLTPYAFHYIIVLLLSQVITITSAFLVYKFFVFKSRSNPIYEYLRFVSVYLVGLLLNLGLLVILVDYAKLDAILSQGMATVLIVVLSYVSHRNFSFRVG